MTDGSSWRSPFIRAARAGAFMLAHSLVAVVLIALLTGVSRFLDYMGDHRLFQRVPLSYVFDAMDCAILLVFGTFGVLEAVEAFRGSDNAEPARAVKSENGAREPGTEAGVGAASRSEEHQGDPAA